MSCITDIFADKHLIPENSKMIFTQKLKKMFKN